MPFFLKICILLVLWLTTVIFSFLNPSLDWVTCFNKRTHKQFFFSLAKLCQIYSKGLQNTIGYNFLFYLAMYLLLFCIIALLLDMQPYSVIIVPKNTVVIQKLSLSDEYPPILYLLVNRGSRFSKFKNGLLQVATVARTQIDFIFWAICFKF